MGKKKPKVKDKLDSRLQKHQEAYARYEQLSINHHELASRARQKYADLSAELAGLKVGDYIAVKAYGRETPMLVLSFHANSHNYRDDYQLDWHICCHQVKADGTKHNGHSYRDVKGDPDADGEGWRKGPWRKITKEEVSKLAKEQRV